MGRSAAMASSFSTSPIPRIKEKLGASNRLRSTPAWALPFIRFIAVFSSAASSFRMAKPPTPTATKFICQTGSLTFATNSILFPSPSLLVLFLRPKRPIAISASSAAVLVRTILLTSKRRASRARNSAPSPQKVRVTSHPGSPLLVVAAEANGTLAKFGIEVEVSPAPNSDAMRAALAEGSADIAHAAVDNAVALVELNGADVIIVMGGEDSLNELLVQPEIKSIEGLRGKTLIADAVNTAYALQLKKMLLLHGLQAGRDYALKPMGATPQRLAAMRGHQEYAGSTTGPPTPLLAKRE